jgi:hypothetical protein
LQLSVLDGNFPTRFELQIWINKFLAILFDVLPWNVTPSSRFSCNNYSWSTYQLSFSLHLKNNREETKNCFLRCKRIRVSAYFRSVYKLRNMLIKLQTNNNKLQIHTDCDTWTTSLMLLNCKYQMLIFVFHSKSIRCFSVVSLYTQVCIPDLSCAIFSIRFVYRTDVNSHLVSCFIFRTLCYQPWKILFRNCKTTKNNLHETCCKLIIKLCFKLNFLE